MKLLMYQLINMQLKYDYNYEYLNFKFDMINLN